MIASFDRPETSKEIYFALSNSFQLANPLRSPTYKIAGLYAIYAKDICLYVGQSKNVPSRLSTHLTGRYEVADRVDIYFICQDNYEDFYSRNKISQSAILINNENNLINKLNPTENIVVDRGEVSEDELFCNLFDGPNPPYCNAQAYLSKGYITVTDDAFWYQLSIDKRVVDKRQEYLREIKEKAAKDGKI